MRKVCKKAHSSNRFEQIVVDKIKSCHESSVVHVEHEVVIENITIRWHVGQLEWSDEDMERPDSMRLNVAFTEEKDGRTRQSEEHRRHG